MGEPGAREEWALVRALVGTGLACAVVIVTAYELTRAPIATHRGERLRAAVVEVLPGTETVRSYRRRAAGGFEPLATMQAGQDVVHAGYDGHGRLLGFALEARGPGYQDTIELVYGYDPHAERILGFAVLASRETPGLGDRIRADPGFHAAFWGLDARVEPAGPLVRRLEIDAITGATVSSRAVVRIVAASAGGWVPALRAGLATFEE
jgi:Na+-translocating ferredoxin:NAD+ oxidoreductase subunit G